MYVIKNTGNGKWTGAYVNQPGAQHSFTFSLELARKFATREEAEGQRCPGNEVVVPVVDLLR